MRRAYGQRWKQTTEYSNVKNRKIHLTIQLVYASGYPLSTQIIYAYVSKHSFQIEAMIDKGLGQWKWPITIL